MAKKTTKSTTKKSKSPKKEKLSKRPVKDAVKPKKKKKKTKVEKLEGMRAGPPVKEKKRKVKKEKEKTKKTKKETSSLIATDIIERWKSGEALNDLAEVAGLKRSRFRRELTKAVGGKEKYQELRAAGAGGSAKAVGRPSSNGASAPTVDDSKVKRISKTRLEDGWKSHVIYVDKVSVSVFTSPKGNEYVIAKGNEKADLIFQPKGERGKGMDPVRLKKLATSSVGRKAAREQKLIEQGAKSEEARKQEKRAKRQMKKKGVVPEEPITASVEVPKKRSRKTRRKVN